MLRSWLTKASRRTASRARCLSREGDRRRDVERGTRGQDGLFFIKARIRLESKNKRSMVIGNSQRGQDVILGV
jgi:hypothetical protein